MENTVQITEESSRSEAVVKRLHKTKLGLDILGFVLLGLWLLAGLYMYSEYDFDMFFREMVLLLFLFAPVLILCAVVSPILDSCYGYYRCKNCGHIHIPTFEELSNASTGLRCPKCQKTSRHKKILFRD